MDNQLNTPVPGTDRTNEVEIPGTASTPVRGRRRGFVWLLLVLLVLGVGATAFHMHARHVARLKERKAHPISAVSVEIATAKKTDVHVVLDALGTVTPLTTVTVKTQINGQLQQVGFAEGQRVHKGDFLEQIDPRPYQALLEQYEGQLARDQALLKQAEVDMVRYRTLLKQDSVARQTAEDQTYVVQQDQGTVRGDQALIDGEKLNITYCHIISPTDGRVGLRQVDPGNYVQTSDSTGLVVVTQLQPISVVFSLPEDNLPQVLKPLHEDNKLSVIAFDRANTTQLATGAVSTIDNEVDTTTGTWKLRAVFANADEMLFPSQFVNVRLLVHTLRSVLTAPGEAVQRGAPGTYVYFVRPDDTVIVRKVQIGAVDGDTVQILSGLETGDRVVTDGFDRLSDGAHVTVQGNSDGAVATP